MQLTIDFWQLLGGLAAIGAVGLSGVGIIFALSMRGIDRRIEQLGEEIGQQTAQEVKNGERLDRLERDFLTQRAELSEKYVRREDYIRGQSELVIRIDGLALKMENLMLKGVKGEH